MNTRIVDSDSGLNESCDLLNFMFLVQVILVMVELFSILVENQNAYEDNSTTSENQSRRQQVPTNESKKGHHDEDRSGEKDKTETS